MTREQIIEACTELSACMDGKDGDQEKAKGIAFALLVEALLCLRAIADNTAPVKTENRNAAAAAPKA